MSDPTRSVFISRKPYKSGYSYPKDATDNGFHEDFLFVCSEAYPQYSVDYQMTAMGIMGMGTENAIVIDSMGGAVGRLSIGGVRVGDNTYGSNGYFAREIRKMRSIIQLTNNAYMLRIYNATLLDEEGNVRDIGDTFMPFFVYLGDITYTSMAGRPKDLNVGISLTQRNALKGFNKFKEGENPYDT